MATAWDLFASVGKSAIGASPLGMLIGGGLSALSGIAQSKLSEKDTWQAKEQKIAETNALKDKEASDITANTSKATEQSMKLNATGMDSQINAALNKAAGSISNQGVDVGGMVTGQKIGKAFADNAGQLEAARAGMMNEAVKTALSQKLEGQKGSREASLQYNDAAKDFQINQKPDYANDFMGGVINYAAGSTLAGDKSETNYNADDPSIADPTSSGTMAGLTGLAKNKKTVSATKPPAIGNQSNLPGFTPLSNLPWKPQNQNGYQNLLNYYNSQGN